MHSFRPATRIQQGWREDVSLGRGWEEWGQLGEEGSWQGFFFFLKASLHLLLKEFLQQAVNLQAGKQESNGGSWLLSWRHCEKMRERREEKQVCST